MYLLVLLGYLVMYYARYFTTFNSVRRKLQIATWDDIGDSQIYGSVSVRTDKLDKCMKEFNEKNPGYDIDYIHLLGYVIGNINYSDPKKRKAVVQTISAGVRIIPENPALTIIKNMNGDKLDYFTTDQIKGQSVPIIAKKMNEKKKNELKSIEGFQFLRYIPNYMIDWYFYILNFLSYDCNLSIPFLNINSCQYGQVIGYDLTKDAVYDVTFPIPRLTRSVSCVTMNAPRERVIVDEETGKPIISKQLKFNIAFDHRAADGVDAKYVVLMITDLFHNPEKYLVLQQI